MKYHRRARRRRRDDRTARARGSDAAEQPSGVAKCMSQTNPVCACVCVCVFMYRRRLLKKKASYTHSRRLSSGVERLSDNQYFSHPNHVGRKNNKKIKINVYYTYVCVCLCNVKKSGPNIIIFLLLLF